MSLNFCGFLQELSIINEGVDSFEGEKCYMATGDLSNDASHELESVSYHNRPSRAALTAKPGDVIFARMKGTNKVLLITENESDYIFSTGFVVLRSSEKVDKSFLTHYLKSNLFQDEKDKLCTGATQKSINNQNIEKLKFPFPPLSTQKRIAEILDAADALRRKDQELLKKYDELAQAIFIDMFGDPVKNDKGWDVKTIRSIGLRISDGPFGSNLKTEHYSKEGVRVIRLKNIGINSFNDEDSAFVNINHYENVLKKYTCIPGDILIGTLGEPNLRACIFPDHLEKAVNKADCVMLRLDPEICSQNYLAYLLNSPSFVESVANKLHGQTRTRISMGQVANLLINIPPKSLQYKFSDLIANIMMQNDKRTLQLINSSTLFNSIIQKAFNGELVS